MSLRLSLYTLSHRHRLDREGQDRLFAAAGLSGEPAALRQGLWPAVAVLAAALGGLGIILWLAANWPTLGRTGRFALLQGLVAVLCLGAWLQPRARAPLGLLALLGIGGLFAYFGQTYQTGADPWQLFALWAALALPLALGVRSDVVWAPWALVACTGISLWAHAHTGHQWRVQPGDVVTQGVAWTAAALVVGALGRPLRRWTGAGAWSQRTAATLAVVMITLTAIGGLFHSPVAPQFTAALALLAIAFVLLSWRRLFEVFVLSAVALALNTLVVAGLLRAVFKHFDRDPILILLLLGLAAAGMLAATVSFITGRARRYAPPAEGGKPLPAPEVRP